jgi:hypothetical protein
MSTRSTIAYSDRFHLYEDLTDPDNVQLELDTTDFDASYGRVRVAVPLHVWEVIREYAVARFDLADMDDAALEAYVKGAVTERLKKIAKHQAATGKADSIYSWIGSATYGSGTDPYEKQVETGIISLKQERKRQREIRAAIENLKKEQKKPIS